MITVVACGGGGGTPPAANSSFSGLLIAPGNVGGPNATATADTLPILDLRNDLGNGPVEVVPGEVFIRFQDGVRAQQLGTLSVGGVTLQRVDTQPARLSQRYRSEGLSQAQTRALVETLNARPDVIEAHPNWILRAFAEPNDSFYPAQWHYTAMNLPAAWDIETGSSPVRVAVLDTGMVAHPDLTNAIAGFDFVADVANGGDGNGYDNDATDEGGDSGFHGAHVAGTIAATTNNALGIAGVSWRAAIVPVRVLGIDGTGTFDDIFNGMLWAAGRSVPGVVDNPNPASILNLSLGGDVGGACPTDFQNLVNDLVNDNVAIVVAAGNENTSTATVFPANCAGVITVGATGPQGNRAPYSNFGTEVDVMAPGGDTSQTFEFQGQTYVAGVLSTVQDDTGGFGYAFYQGTSMAAPHIAGLATLMRSQDPTLSLTDLVTRLRNAATPLSQAECGGVANGCGAGFVDAAQALGSNSTPTPPPPPPTQEITTFVVAFYCTIADLGRCLDEDDGIDFDRSKLISVTQTQDETNYNVTGLEPGNYIAAGFQDLNDNGDFDGTEPLGLHPRLVALDSGQSIGGIDIRLEAITTSALESSRALPFAPLLNR
ncbi:MAG: S8 family peptidase [Trueperaceae bacterium]|nr:S8 family peptidase [Trueperaceae bacterium]